VAVLVSLAVGPTGAPLVRPTGLTQVGEFLLPAATGELLSYSFYRFECAIRSAAVLGLVGAGGLGFQLSLSLSALRYDEIWTLLAALAALCAVADAAGSVVRRRLAARGEGRDPVLRGALAVAVLTVPVAAWWTGQDLRPLVDARSWELAAQLLAESWPPTLGAGPAGAGGSGAGGITGLLALAGTTLAMSVLAIALAFAGGLVLAGPAVRPVEPGATLSGTGRRIASVIARALLVALRAVPPPVWALLVLFVLRPGLLAGAVALGCYTVGVLGRLMAETVENLERRPRDALRPLGASGVQTFAYGTLPAAAPRFAAYGLYRWEVTIRETVVVGVVGAGGLGQLLATQLALFDYGGAVTTLATLLLLTLLVDLTSAALRRAVR
jgi:phosphonate transport system permease protein